MELICQRTSVDVVLFILYHPCRHILWEIGAMKAVILDFDGTLLDSYPRALAQLGMLARRNGLLITEEVRRGMLERWGHTGVEFLQYIFDIDHERAKRVYQDWEAMDTEHPIPLVVGAQETLKWLHAQGYAACVLTSRHRATVIDILGREGLRHYFARITAREDSTFFKPDKRAFTGILQTLARQHVPREECIFVGDTLVDIEAGRNAGIETLVVETGPYRDGHDKTHPVPDTHVIPSIAELPAWIDSRGW